MLACPSAGKQSGPARDTVQCSSCLIKDGQATLNEISINPVDAGILWNDKLSALLPHLRD